MRLVEKSARRSHRRHQRERALAHALGIARRCYSSLGYQATRDEAEKEARFWALRLHQNPKLCGCWMCSRPRKRRKGENRFNFQERKLRQENRLECRIERGSPDLAATST
jgi:hypothetical protein